MALLSPDQKDITAIAAASKEVIQDAIGETGRVLVQPFTDALTGALANVAGQLVPATQEVLAALKDLPEIAGESMSKVLDEVDGLTVTATVTLTVSRKSKS